MRKLILTIAAIAFFNVSIAQQKSQKNFNPETKANKKVEQLSNSISISDSQKESLKTVFLDFYSFSQEIKNKEEVTKEDRVLLKNNREERDNKVKAILNDTEKFEMYQNVMSQKRKYADRGKHGKFDKKINPADNAKNKAISKVNRISNSIEIDNTQKDSLISIFTERSIARKNLMQNENVSDSDRQTFKNSMKEFEKRIENVFGDKEKYSKYLEFNKQNRNKNFERNKNFRKDKNQK